MGWGDGKCPFTAEACTDFCLCYQFSISGQYDFEFLRNLESQTTYCVQVRGFLPDRDKAGEWSEPVCEQTTIDGESSDAPSAVLCPLITLFFFFLDVGGGGGAPCCKAA